MLVTVSRRPFMAPGRNGPPWSPGGPAQVYRNARGATSCLASGERLALGCPSAICGPQVLEVRKNMLQSWQVYSQYLQDTCGTRLPPCRPGRWAALL